LDQLELLRTVAALSEQMLSAARAYQWEELAALEMRERALVAQLQTQGGLIDATTDTPRKLLQTALDNYAAIADITQPLWQDLKILLDAFPESAETEK